MQRFHQTSWRNIWYAPVVPQPFACCRSAGEPTHWLFPLGRMATYKGFSRPLLEYAPPFRSSMDRRSPISPPGTRPHPMQSNENHWWPNPAAHLSHSSSCQCVDLTLQVSMHLRPSPVDKYGSTSRPTRSSSANQCPTRRSPPASNFLSATGSLTRLLDPFISLLCPQLLELTSSEHYPAPPILEGSAAVQDNGLPPPFTQEFGAVH